jgi:hypothetical protein
MEDTMLKKQKLLAICFCAVLLLGFSSVAANAQTELTGTVYRLSIMTSVGINLNADATFQTDSVFLLSLGAGKGSYYTYLLDPNIYFLTTYSAYNVAVGDITASSLSMYFTGAILSEGKSMLGVGLALLKGEGVSTDPIYFFFSGTRIATEE